MRQFAISDTSDNPSWLARTLFTIRWKLGALLGWDDPDACVGSRVPTLRDRLPADLDRSRRDRVFYTTLVRVS